jgi:ABC-type branched-subunit amino acid transport system substrate-binding protein
LAIAACGGGGSSSSSGEASTAPTESTEESTSETAPAKEATGSPLKVLVVAFVNSPFGSVPELFAGAEVAAEKINEEGGVNGHPIKIVTCNGKGDPKLEVACAQKGVEENVIAADSSVWIANPEGAIEVLNRAGVAEIAGAGGATINFSSPNTFPIDFEAATTTACFSKVALDKAGKDAKLGNIHEQQPYAEGIWAVEEPAIKADPEVSARFVGSVTAPVTTQDYGPYVQKLDEMGADYVMPLISPGAMTNFMGAASASGKKWKYCTLAGVSPPELLKQVGPLADEFYTAEGYPAMSDAPEVPIIAEFLEQIEAANEAGKANTELDKNAYNLLRPWLGIQVFKQVVETMKGEIDSKSFMDAINKAEVDLGYAKLNFAKPLGTPPYERVFQPITYLADWNNDSSELETFGKTNTLESTLEAVGK